MTKSQNTKNEQQKDLCITSEQQVWASTLHRSMVLEAENAQLKELLKECQNMIAFKHEVYEEDALIKEIDEALK